MPIEPQRVLADLQELRALTADARGAQRLAWSSTWLKARAWFQSRIASLPVVSHTDAAGNVWTTLQGKSATALVLGSHLDSVPNGGWLDGALGVLAALEVLRTLIEDYDGHPPITVRIVDWADEEGARFGRSLFGSSAFAGNTTIVADRLRIDAGGTTLEHALKACGVEIDQVAHAAIERANVGAYLELHIEQGPVLEHAGLPLGVVSGTKGVERHSVKFCGQEAHSGSTPMTVRRDALAAAARLALAIREIAGKHADAVCTMGSVKTYPGIVTAIVGRCETTLDQRDLDPLVLAEMLTEAREASQRFAEMEGCTVEWSPIWSIEPIPFDRELVELCDASLREMGVTPLKLPSGPLHDAAEVARAGVPTAMIFVQSLRGISHNPLEDTKSEHLELAVQAFYLLSCKTITWLLGR